MTGIIIGLIIACITTLRSFENVVTNKKITSRINKFYIESELYIRQIINSTYKTASKNLLITSIKHFISFTAVLTVSIFSVLGLTLKIDNINKDFIINQTTPFIVIMIILFIARFGTNTFKEFQSLLKKEIKEILKSKTTWLLIFLGYTLILFIICISLTTLKKHFLFSYWQIFDELIINGSIYDSFFIVISTLPFLALLALILIIIITYPCIWSFSRLVSFVSYLLLKRCFMISLFLNNEEPLKPLLLIVQVAILILTPVFAFIIKLL